MNVIHVFRSRTMTVFAAAMVAGMASMAHAATLYSNVAISTGTSCQISYNCSGSQQFTSNSAGYDFVYTNWSTATSTGAPDNSGGSDHVILGTANSNAAATTSAFLALDSDYPNGNLTGNPAMITDVSGLTIGDNYTIAFKTADAQQTGYAGPTDDQVKICFGTVCYTTTDVVDAVTGGSTPWVSQSYTFTATGTDELLSFLGIGGYDPTSCNSSTTDCSHAYDYHGNQVPAFALVDNLSITQSTPSATPEPSSLMLMGTGVLGLAGSLRRRFVK